MSIELAPPQTNPARTADYRNGTRPGGTEAQRTDSGFAAEMRRLSAKKADTAHSADRNADKAKASAKVSANHTEATDTGATDAPTTDAPTPGAKAVQPPFSDAAQPPSSDGVLMAQLAADLPPTGVAVTDGMAVTPDAAQSAGAAAFTNRFFATDASPSMTAGGTASTGVGVAGHVGYAGRVGNTGNAHVAGGLSLAQQAGQAIASDPSNTVSAGIVGQSLHTALASAQAAQSSVMGAAERQAIQTASLPTADMVGAWASAGDAWKSLHERSKPAGSAVASPEGSWTASGVGMGVGAGLTGAGLDRATYEVSAPQTAVADTSVADTVSYWAAQGGIQNAELTLDGFGKDPVEVSISLHRDQAQIGFKTDQAEVRQALEGAASQLKDMLSGEGLQLAGMSVGTSGRDGAGGGDDQRQRSQQARRSALVGAAPVPVSAPAARAARATARPVGRSLDLFV